MPQERDLFANFERMRREMDELFGDALDRGLAPRRRGGFSPAVDVYYASDPPRAVVRADLAGIDPNQVQLEVRGRELVLSGHRETERQSDDRVYQQLEIERGPFRRVVALGAEVDADAANATYEDGILTVELPLLRPARLAHRPDSRDRAVSAVEGEVPEGLPDKLPVLPLRDTVTYPDTLTPLAVGQERSIQLVNDVLTGDRMLVMLGSKDPDLETPGPDELHTVGVAGVVARMLKVPDGSLRILVQAGQRVRIDEWIGEEPYLVARVSEIPDEIDEGPELTALMRNVQQTFTRIIEEVPYLPEELQMAVANLEEPSALSHLIAGALRIKVEEKQELLEEVDVSKRLRRLSEILARELDIVAIGSKIQSQVMSEMESSQREYVLRQQLKAIQEELGEKDPAEAEVDELREQLAEIDTPRGRPQAGRPRALAAREAPAGGRRARRHPHLPGVDRVAAVGQAHRRQPRPRARARRSSTKTTTTSPRSRSGSSSSWPCASSSRTRPAPRSCASSARRASARRRSAARSRARWAASSSASAPAASATRPRSAATAGPTSARCPERSSARCGTRARTTRCS